MGAQQKIAIVNLPGTGAAVPIAFTFPAPVDFATAYPMDVPGNGVSARYAVRADDPNTGIIIEPDAGGVAGDYWYSARFYHSAFRRAFVRIDLTVPPLSTVPWVWPPSPPMTNGAVHVELNTHPGAAVDWAVTRLDDPGGDVKNWDAVTPIEVTVYGYTYYSLTEPSQLPPVRPLFADLPDTNPVAIPHGMSQVPDVVYAFPFAPDGLVRPAGTIRMPAPPDDTNIYLSNVANVGPGVMQSLVWAEATHSVQQ